MNISPLVRDRPEDHMHRLLGGHRVTQMLFVAASLGIADELAERPRSVDSLALATGANSRALFRLLRALAGIGVFRQRSDGLFELTALAQTLQKDAPGQLRAVALSYGQPWWWHAFGELLHTVRTGETAFDRVHGMGLFEYLQNHCDAAKIFNANMTAMTAAEATAVVDAYDFSSVGVLVDVGGGHGALSAAVLGRYPNAKVVIFDKPAVVESAPLVLRGLGVEGHYELVAGDFFDSVPSGGNVYVLKDVIHDWNDDAALRILRSVRKAMPADARLLVIERIVPTGNEPFVGKDVDITMLALTGGLERTESEYRRLLDLADLRLDHTIPTSTPSSVIEAVRK